MELTDWTMSKHKGSITITYKRKENRNLIVSKIPPVEVQPYDCF